MPRKTWPLRNNRPAVRVLLTETHSGQPLLRDLLADTGAGSARAGIQLLLADSDCLLCGSALSYAVTLGGAYAGSFPVYMVRVRIPDLGFDQSVATVGVASCPRHFDGIACFRFLNHFTYGNFGDPREFGLET